MALGAVAAAALARWLLSPLLASDAPYLTFFVAIVFAAVTGGLTTAVIATLASAAAVVFLPIFGDPGVAAQPAARWSLGFFVIAGGIIGVIGDRFLAAMGRARAATAEADRARTTLHGALEEREHATALLRQSDERFRLLTRATREPVWDLDLRAGSMWWSDAIRDLVGAAPDAGTLDWWTARLHPDDRERVAGSREAFASGRDEIWREQYRVTRADGRHATVVDRGLALRDASGAAVRMIGAIVDVTEERQQAELRQMLLDSERAARTELERLGHLRDEFVAVLSHELRTPLNAILGWCAILREGVGAEQQAEAVEIIRRNAKTQAQLINDLLDMSAIANGKLRLDLHRIDLGRLVGAGIDAIRPVADAKCITLALDVPSARVDVWGDSVRLNQIVSNLVSNAIKFTPRQGRISVRVSRDGTARVSVADSGQGIEPDQLGTIFDRFRQGDASASRSHRGLGLGLAIARHLAELHAGSLTAASAGRGLGSTFTLEMPLADAASESTATAASVESTQAPQTLPDLGGTSILVVEDDADSRQLLQRVLEDAGALVTAVASAREALLALDGAPPHVFISDIGLSGHDGFELIRTVRTRPPALGGQVPAIALTAYARPDDRQRALDSGFDVHVAKPFKPLELLQTVQRLAQGG